MRYANPTMAYIVLTMNQKAGQEIVPPGVTGKVAREAINSFFGKEIVWNGMSRGDFEEVYRKFFRE